MATSSARATGGSRAATRELRREQLIKSTIDSIARHGFADTTLANVADGAGLSRGIVNFHFQSKDQLLVETLRHLADEYLRGWKRALDRAGPAPAERLRALVGWNFDASVCNRRKVAVWFAFYGESKSRPVYRELCGAMDREHFEASHALCEALIEEGGYDVDARSVATGLGAMTDGLWLDLLTAPGSFSRDDARRAVGVYLRSVFPQHFASADALAA